MSSILSVLPGVGGRVFLGDVAPQPRCVFGCPPKRVLCDSRCNTKLPELELGQKPPIFVAGSSQAGSVVAVDSGLSAIQRKGLPSAAAPAIFSMVNPLKIVMQGLQRSPKNRGMFHLGADDAAPAWCLTEHLNFLVRNCKSCQLELRSLAQMYCGSNVLQSCQ